MKSVRIARTEPTRLSTVCSRCARANGRWDRIAGVSYCPACQEAIVLGEAPAVSEKPQPLPCAVCSRRSTLCFQTVPLQTAVLVEMDLCGEHLRGLLARQLSPHAFLQLQRQLLLLAVSVEQLFLLHEAFYDARGRALQPALGGES